MNESIKKFRNNLIENWVVYDMGKMEEHKKDFHTMKKEDYRKKYGFTGASDFDGHLEGFKEKNEKAADKLIQNAINKVIKITGEVESFDSITFKHGELNGIVTGKNGKASITTILAGGYNIQRLHARILVRKYK